MLNLPEGLIIGFIWRPGFLTDEDNGASLPFADEFEVKILAPPPIGVSNVVRVEYMPYVAYYHLSAASLCAHLNI